jgi:uncharacterized NAD(P)/FAD-binding protein YdhS
MKTVTIIGGGFSGTLTSVNLVRFSEMSLRVCLVNSGHPVGRGVAYSTRKVEHLLNVAARNMSALADHPTHFVEWLRTRSEYADLSEPELRELFVPRKVYGDYLRTLLLWHSRPLQDRPNTQIEVVDEEAVDIVPGIRGATVRLASGTDIKTNKVVLATGNAPPAEMPTSAAAFRHPRYVENPWKDWESRLPDRNETAVLLGTGLTMADVFLTLKSQGWQGPIVAVSRHGLLPLSHFRGIEYADFPPSDVAALRLSELVSLVEDHCARLTSRGANSAIIVDKFRPHTQHIWQNLSLAEKREFCDRHSARWNVIRHRVAQQVHEQISAAVESGVLKIVKGKIRDLKPVEQGVGVGVVIDEAEGGQRTITGGVVINCTGPQVSLSATAMPLMRNLLRRGAARVDAMDMGLNVTADFAAVNGNGDRSPFLFALGPLLKGTLWETTAVPELRSQTFRLAQTLLDELWSEGRAESWASHVDEEILEYCI